MKKLKISDLFSPIKTNSVENTCEILPWNRKYTLAKSPFLSSITSNGQELLSAPMRLVGIENGNEIVMEDVTNCLMVGATKDSVSACQYMQSNSFLFDTSVTTESDGFMKWNLTVASRGRSVAQVFGLANIEDNKRELSRLWLEIPLKKSVCISYQYAPQSPIKIDGEIPDKPMPLYMAGAMAKKSIEFPFVQQVFLSNDNVGFALVFESDENWQYDDENKVIECIVNEEDVVLRVHLLDSEPKKWLNKKDYHDGLDLLPISFSFGMQVTPVKPFPKNPYKEKNLHIDCFKKILEPYEDFLLNKFEDTAEITLDRIQKLGVNTLYIHEKWNDIQNSPLLTEKSAWRLKLIIKEAHKRKIKVIPYFGYELSTLFPDFAKKHEEYLCGNIHWHWYRFPYQRALRVCYNSGWQDVFVENFIKLYDEFGFDGLYFDSVLPEKCNNLKHGCGYVDENGKVHGTYPTLAYRNLVKRLYTAIEERGGTFSLHSCATFPMAMIAYTHEIWDGETVQGEFLKGNLTRVPEDYYRSVYSGRNIGVPINMLCYSNPPSWTFEEAMSNALFLGIIPKPIDTGYPLEIMNKLWNILDSYPIEKATWINCYDSQISVDNPDLRLGYYKTDKEYLCFISNMHKEEVTNAKITLPVTVAKVTDAYSGENIALSTDNFTINVSKFGHRILKVKI